MYDSKYDSKMHDITIPLMGFNGFHHAGNKDDFDNFIGRESILDKLKMWLVDEGDKKRNTTYSTNYSGAYLVTGFRGMGKSAFVHKAIKDIKKHDKEKKKSKALYVPISINVGNDMLTSKELLYIICKLLSARFDEETRLFNSNKIKKSKWDILGLTKWQKAGGYSHINLAIGRLIALTGAILCLIQVIRHLPSSFSFISSSIKTTVASNTERIIHLGNTETLCYLVLCICSLLAFFLMRRLYYHIWNYSGSKSFITSWQIKRTFRHLNERIDSEMTESSEYGFDSAKNSKPMDVVPGLKFLKNKKNIYPIAQTSEIQDLLVKQLDLIKNLPHTNFRIIFIIDELDKVSPEDIEKQIVPEYNSANVVNGNSTYNSRQRAFVNLLSNMKYFISSSEAKFIFITGYDMYEATLSDISNREFNIHSIFNGYINVSSFLRKTGNSKGADSLIEEYFCRMLLTKDQDNRPKDLQDYADFFKKKWEEQKDSLNVDVATYKTYLERRINFIRHFLTYLFYMSNGSPKKLAMYMEKYVRSKDRVMQQIDLKSQKDKEIEYRDISMGVNEFWEDCKWFLYFDIRNIQKIEFINYLIYPMIKNLIAKSSIYNDKLLVSTSFMISNLYKFHKSGFSWRNLEYLPELLDINKTPELRDFIGGILQFLNQTHIDETVGNLYKFKFPQRLSEEITYFSKTAEEVSYLFNFSHDELLSIKKLYYQELDHYHNPLNESPALASIHHMLGDIYILEENYEQAIFEYSQALNSVARQSQDMPENEKDHSNTLFIYRVTLKLGLAYEKRKTCDTAYVTYENLTKRITKDANNSLRTCEFLQTINNQDITQVLDSHSSFFFNIRISYLAILAKVAVLEKMDLGGIRELDLIRIHMEFNTIVNRLNDEIRPITIIDFYTKLGDILFYKNGAFSCNNNAEFINVITRFRNRLELRNVYKEKFDTCQHFLNNIGNGDSTEVSRRANAPCIACQCFNKALKHCLEEFNVQQEDYNEHSRSTFFLKRLFDDDQNGVFVKRGNTFMLAMANALVGMGNTLLGCIKDSPFFNIDTFFTSLYRLFQNRLTMSIIQEIERIEFMDINHYAKSILYYLSAARTYELLSDYKAAYNIYLQILDAVIVYHQAIKNNYVKSGAINFCKKITEQAIQCTYLHYDSINCAEVDTIKHELGQKHIDYINLHTLTNFPEIEVAIEKYYQICLRSDEKEEVLKIALNSRQLGCYKLISTLTQNIQNLYFKVLVNEEILSRILPDLWDSFIKKNFKIDKTITYIANYYTHLSTNKFEELFNELEWKLLDNSSSAAEKRFNLLDFLLKDTLFCLNMITELIDPLYCTTLYNNSFIGDIFMKSFIWNHILICIREIFGYAENPQQGIFSYEMRKRYAKSGEHINFSSTEQALDDCKKFLFSLESWKNYSNGKISRMESIYQKINPGGNYNHFLTSSYLTGNAIDRYSRAIEMHTSGKAYKEMMSTLFFLEDDLHNDSNYLNLAIERFLINHGVVQKDLKFLKEYTLRESSLIEIQNYVKL